MFQRTWCRSSSQQCIPPLCSMDDGCYFSLGEQLHFDSRTRPAYTYPTGKEGIAGQGNHCTTNRALPRRVLISSPCIHFQKANKCQHLKERVKWCFWRGLGIMIKQSIGLKYLHMLRTTPQRQAHLHLLSCGLQWKFSLFCQSQLHNQQGRRWVCQIFWPHSYWSC